MTCSTFVINFGKPWRDSITELLHVCQLHIHNVNFLFHCSSQRCAIALRAGNCRLFECRQLTVAFKKHIKRWTDVAFKWCSVLHTITSLKVVSEFGLQLFTGGFSVNFYLWASEVCSHGHNMIYCAIPCGLFLFVCALVFAAFMSKDRF